MMVIAVVERPIPIIHLIMPAIKKVKATIMAISFGLYVMPNTSTF
jgi:3-polyprenyl-4-hydroxybenzoate decarboxylase